MLLKEDYRKITVTALCRQAVINKKTFYRYYDSVDALLEEILSEFSKGYVDTIADYRVRRIWIRSTLLFSIMLSIKGRCMKKSSAPYRIST